MKVLQQKIVILNKYAENFAENQKSKPKKDRGENTGANSKMKTVDLSKIHTWHLEDLFVLKNY